MAALLALAACSGGATASNQSAKSGTISGKITVWDYLWDDDTYGPGQKAVDALFLKKYPDVQINHIGKPGDQSYYEALSAANASRTGPDVLTIKGGGFVLQNKAALEPLNNKITPEMLNTIGGWESAAEDYNVKKTIYGVPRGLTGYACFYNKELFKKAGLDPETPPKTQAELNAAAEKLLAAGIIPIGGGNVEGYMSEWWLATLWGAQNDADTALATARGQLSWTSPELKSVVQPYVDMIKKGYFGPAFASTPAFPDSIDQFQTGKRAIYCGPHAVVAPTLAKLGKDNVGMWAGIAGDGQTQPKSEAYGSIFLWSESSYSKNKDAAWAYIQFASSPEATQAWHNATKQLENSNNYTIDPDVHPALAALAKAYSAASKSTGSSPTLAPETQALLPVDVLMSYRREMQNVVSGKTSLDSALVKVQKAAVAANN